jgi:hypothetical protein
VYKDEHRKTGALERPTPDLSALLELYDLSPTNVLGFARALRYDEGVLEAGEHVAVCGVPRRYPDRKAGTDPEIPSELDVRWVLEPDGELPLYVSDDPAALLRPPSSAKGDRRRKPRPGAHA